LFERGQTALAHRVLSNLAEMDLENRHFLRVLAYRLMQANSPQLAVPVLRKVLVLSPNEPQSYRDLGLALAANNQPQLAADQLYEVVVRPWHNRFPGVELIALAELNALAANQRIDTSRYDPRLLRNLPLDLRVVLTWDADNTDIDLWVSDPLGDKAHYARQLTTQGGRMSADFTGGYGPEEFSLRAAAPGKYKIEAEYFGDRQQTVAAPTTLQVRVTTGFGTSKQKDQFITLQLKDKRDRVYVGEIDVR
jgi:Ca-activated chloride channel homolog